MERFPEEWRDLNVVLSHDWLTGMRGGERVLEVLCRAFPSAPIFTLFHNVSAVSELINAHTVHTTHFDLVTLEGELKLRNYEKRSVKITVTNPVPGKPLKAEQDGALSTDSTKLKLSERQGSITWNVELEPGEETTLKYVYERYVKAL